MENFLIKYKSAEDYSSNGFIKAVYTDTPFETLKVLKEVSSVVIDGTHYEFLSSTYKVPVFEEELDVIVVYVVEVV